MINQIFQFLGEVVQDYGYMGVFVMNFLGSMSVILSIPANISVLVSGSKLNPWMVGLSAGVGAALGEAAGYVLGSANRKILEGRYKRWMDLGEEWFRRGAKYPIIIVFAMAVLPGDVVGLLCRIFDYDLKKLLLFAFIGKTVANIMLVFVGIYIIGQLLSLF